MTGRAIRIALGLGLVLVQQLTLAQTGPNVEGFIQADLDTRRVTIEQMQTRLERLQQGASLQEEMALVAQSERAVQQAYGRQGFSAGSHAAFAQRYAEAIDAYLEANPQLQTEYGLLSTRFLQLGDDIHQARQAQGR